MNQLEKTPVNLLVDVRGLIDQARAQVALTANSTLTMLYWNVGRRIQREVLQDGRAGYGAQILATLSQELARDYGKGFNVSALTRMVKFAEAFPDETIVASLSRQLSWSHFIEILPLKAPLEREYYAELCRIERWSVRTLRDRIGGQLYLHFGLGDLRRRQVSTGLFINGLACVVLSHLAIAIPNPSAQAFPLAQAH